MATTRKKDRIWLKVLLAILVAALETIIICKCFPLILVLIFIIPGFVTFFGEALGSAGK